MSTRITPGKSSARTKRKTSIKTPAQERSKFTVEQILTAATQVFEQQGYAAGTTNRIAAHAGVSVGTLYQYFSNKESILIALLERHIQATLRGLHEWAGHVLSKQHGLEAALREYVSNMLALHSDQPRLQHILLEETPLPEDIHRLLMSADADSANTMSAILKVFPEINKTPTEACGYFVIQTVESLTHRYAAHPNDRLITEEIFVEELVRMLVSYLVAPVKSQRYGNTH